MGLQTENSGGQECVSIGGDARKQRIPHPICLAIPLCQNFHLLTFHITDLDHFCGHLPSKPDGFFHTPRPHAAIIHRIHPGQGAKIVSSPSISPTWTTFAAIYPQNSACFSPPFAPILTPCPPFPVCRRKRPLIFHITELARFCGHLTSKIGTFFGSPAPHCLFRPSPPSACGTKTSLSYSISPSWSTFTLICPQNSILFSGG